MNTLRKTLFLFFLFAVYALTPSAFVFAHGALMEYAFTPGITILAKYDTGHPMAGAQITVYAPDNPAKPWLSGTSDEEGRFSFVPAPDMPGMWTIQTRQAGHGAMIHIPMDQAFTPDTGAAPVSTGPNTWQRLLMALAVAWGCVGTALYFTHKKNDPRTT